MVRLRLINTQSRPSALAVTGTPYRVVSIDGIDLRGPGEPDRLWMAPRQAAGSLLCQPQRRTVHRSPTSWSGW
jgi:FtsP/CotA-like multicopper oxidase with cupredoxin domain